MTYLILALIVDAVRRGPAVLRLLEAVAVAALLFMVQPTLWAVVILAAVGIPGGLVIRRILATPDPVEAA